MDAKKLQEKTYVNEEPKEMKWHRRPWNDLIFVLILVFAVAIFCICQYGLRLNRDISALVACLACGLLIWIFTKHMQSTLLRCIADFRTAEGFSDENFKVGVRWNMKERQVIFTVKPNKPNKQEKEKGGAAAW